MLKLVRRLNERIIIDDEMLISILGINRYQVKLGFQFPASMTILREEVFMRLSEEEQKKAPVYPLLKEERELILPRDCRKNI